MSRWCSLFGERKAVWLWSTRGAERSSALFEELGWSCAESAQALESHRWEALSLHSPTATSAPAEVREALKTLSQGAGVAGAAQEVTLLAERLVARASGAGLPPLEVIIREQFRSTFAGSQTLAHEVTRSVVIHLRLVLGPSTTWRGRSYPDLEAMLADGPQLEALAEQTAQLALAKQTLAPCPSGAVTLVLAPGRAGAFFHEICGHPLEGDVVARGASYLARLKGQAIGPSFLTVSDSPAPGLSKCGFRFDDEGTAAREVLLVAGGVVSEPLLDLHHADALGLPPNGHARRGSFRDFPLPRMSHTEVKPHQRGSAEIIGEVARGLEVSLCTPRHVNLMTGEYSFFIDEAREIIDGRVGAFVEPGLMRGDGLAALRSIDAVGADSEDFLGLKGCGKLNQGNLPVSFGLPTVRFQNHWVEPRR